MYEQMWNVHCFKHCRYCDTHSITKCPNFLGLNNIWSIYSLQINTVPLTKDLDSAVRETKNSTCQSLPVIHKSTDVVVAKDSQRTPSRRCPPLHEDNQPHYPPTRKARELLTLPASLSSSEALIILPLRHNTPNIQLQLLLHDLHHPVFTALQAMPLV